jgi:hypothetical protein
MMKKETANGSQSKQINAIMGGSYANMIEDKVMGRTKGFAIGLIGGVILGALTRQNSVVTGIIGGIIGFLVSNKSEI